jgi:hypothetical protein
MRHAAAAAAAEAAVPSSIAGVDTGGDEAASIGTFNIAVAFRGDDAVSIMVDDVDAEEGSNEDSTRKRGTSLPFSPRFRLPCGNPTVAVPVVATSTAKDDDDDDDKHEDVE